MLHSVIFRSLMKNIVYGTCWSIFLLSIFVTSPSWAGNRYYCPHPTEARPGSSELLIKVFKQGVTSYLNLSPQLKSLEILQILRNPESSSNIAVDTLATPARVRGTYDEMPFDVAFQTVKVVAGLRVHDEGDLQNGQFLAFMEKVDSPTVGLLVDVLNYRFSLCTADDNHPVDTEEVKSLVSTFSKNLRQVLGLARVQVDVENGPQVYLAWNRIQKIWPTLSIERRDVVVGTSLTAIAGSAMAARNPVVRAGMIRMAERIAQRVATVEAGAAIRALTGRTLARWALGPLALAEWGAGAGASENPEGLGYGHFYTPQGIDTITKFDDRNFDHYLNSYQFFGSWILTVDKNLLSTSH